MLPEENNTSIEALPWPRLPQLCGRVDLDVLAQELLVVRTHVHGDGHHRLLRPAFKLTFQLDHVGEELKVGGVEKDNTVETRESPEINKGHFLT